MSELSKFINLTIQYGEKLQSTLNKKYRQFIRSICNLQQLAKTVDPHNIHLTHEFIIFKLGLEAKSTKAIQVSLYYLQKFFINKFIDLNQPNHCSEYQIDETTVRRKQNVLPKGDMRHELLRLLQPLVHFKSPEINLLLTKVYEYLITEPIAPALLQLTLSTPQSELAQKTLHNYYSYRFYIYEEVYTFTQQQFRAINPLCIRNQHINKQVESAFVNHEQLLDLVHKYVSEIVTTVSGAGGKYGLCVICKQPADYYCKVTRASLCGGECKKRHLELAEKQYKLHYQAVHLWIEIRQSFQLLLEALTHKESRSLLSVLLALLQKPQLFMLVKGEFRTMIAQHSTGIVNMALQYKDEQAFELTYNLMAVLCRYWILESLSSIEYFFKQCALKVIEDKRPNFRLLMGLFKALAKIFEYGKTTIELYVNFDCQLNRTNVLQRVMFELSKICQDKFANTMYYNKHEKTAVKNGAVALLTILTHGLNDYRRLYPQAIPVHEQILQLKNRKTSLQKFLHKFNEHWSQGLKTLFNMNMVGLESQQEIVEILLTTKGLKKEKIEEMLTSAKEYLDVLFQRLFHQGAFMGLVELFRLVPLNFVLAKMLTSKQGDNNLVDNYGQNITKWATFLTTNYTLKQLEKFMQAQNIIPHITIDHVYMKCLQTRNQLTLGTHKTYFRHCISQSYIQVFEAQLSLLQIPLLYLLQTGYSHEKVFELVTELVQVCPHASWVGLCLKNVDLNKLLSKGAKYSLEDHSIISSCLKQCKLHAEHIHEWPAILQFISRLYKCICQQPAKRLTVTSTTPTILLEQPLRTREQLSVLQLQESLLMIGQHCTGNFATFVIAMIQLSEEELQKENVFFLQKTFEILQHNLAKSVASFQTIIAEFEAMVGRIVRRNLTLANKEGPNTGNNNSPSKYIPNSKSALLPYSTQTLIYIADMLKQLMVKILKYLSTTSGKHNVGIQLSFFKLFSLILQCNNKEASDFVMNSISMIIMVHNEFAEQTWGFIILNILKQYVKEYRQQTLTILQKILKDQLKNCQHLEFQLVNLAIDLVNEKEVKLSIQSLHLIKDFVDFMVRQCEDRAKLESGEEMDENASGEERMIVNDDISQKEQSQSKNIPPTKTTDNQTELIPSTGHPIHQDNDSLSSSSSDIISTSPRKIKQYLLLIISNLVEFITYECHQGAIEILFILMKTKLVLISSQRQSPLTNAKQLLFSPQQITNIINNIFKKLQSLPKDLLSRGEKIMNESLFWSVRNGNFAIVKNLEECIINKFSAMSYTAMKCIKTFVSMTNPKKSEEWDPIEQTLVKILSNTHLRDLLNNGNPQTQNVNIDHIISTNCHLSPNHTSKIPLAQLSNKLIIQRMTVEVLPNDVKIIEQLLRIYEQTVSFNDDIYLRCVLWRQGLGVNNTQSPPDILSLQELISYRIISTYYWSKQYEKIADFTLRIVNKYCEVSRKWQSLQQQSDSIESSVSDETFELYSVSKDYWLRRRQPLKVIVNYMLPKLPKICKNYAHKERLLAGIIEGMKYCEERRQYVQTIRQMTMVR